MNKRGIFFALYIVLLTLVMCGMVIWFYSHQHDRVAGSIVSPVPLLELEDHQQAFEMQEKILILNSAKATVSSLGENKWNSDEFRQGFEDNFFNLLVLPEQSNFRNFLFENLTVNGQAILPEALNEAGEQRNFFKSIYSISFENNKLAIQRKPVSKAFKLEASDKTKINFAVDIEHSYKKDYSFSLNEIKEAK